MGIGWDLNGNLLGFDGGSAHFWELFRFLWELVALDWELIGNKLEILWVCQAHFWELFRFLWE